MKKYLTLALLIWMAGPAWAMSDDTSRKISEPPSRDNFTCPVPYSLNFCSEQKSDFCSTREGDWLQAIGTTQPRCATPRATETQS